METPGKPLQRLVLAALRAGTPGISPEFGAALAQAAAVCLDEQHHTSGVVLQVYGSFDQQFGLYWDDVSDQMRRSWADEPFATEQGAYAVAALLVLELTGLTVIEKSKKGTGFDYWLGEKGSAPLFQGKARLEVSGIRHADSGEVQARTRRKLDQTRRSDNYGLPALVVVVDFGSPVAHLVERQ